MIELVEFKCLAKFPFKNKAKSCSYTYLGNLIGMFM